ncbi:MAG TPA: diacylglycerol kinase [Allosphingosinicella sp.]|nr:diacylglycerol kinase [Allosphingosinicella sp.]
MHGRFDPGTAKNRRFAARLGFAFAGLRLVFGREKSFRTQSVLAFAAALVTLAARPGLIWSALIALAVALVLTLELVNSALEYLLDRLHPAWHREIGAAKDAAAAAVLLASLAALAVGALMLADVYSRGTLTAT